MKPKYTHLAVAAIIAFSFVPTPRQAHARRSPVAPGKEPVRTAVTEAYNTFKSDTSGKNARPWISQT